jgi:hypothetical protein
MAGEGCRQWPSVSRFRCGRRPPAIDRGTTGCFACYRSCSPCNIFFKKKNNPRLMISIWSELAKKGSDSIFLFIYGQFRGSFGVCI